MVRGLWPSRSRFPATEHTHNEIGEVIGFIIVPVLLLFPVDRQRVVVVLRVPHL